MSEMQAAVVGSLNEPTKNPPKKARFKDGRIHGTIERDTERNDLYSVTLSAEPVSGEWGELYTFENAKAFLVEALPLYHKLVEIGDRYRTPLPIEPFKGGAQ